MSAKDLPNRATAEAVRRHAGVTEAQTLDECVLDVGLAGDVAFAQDAVSRQQFAAAAGATLLAVDQPGGEARLAQVARPGAQVRLMFTATAGQQVVARVASTTLPDECFPLQIRDAVGMVSLAFGYVIGGKGETKPWTVPATGTYTVVIDPPGPDTGSRRSRSSGHDRPPGPLPIQCGRCANSGRPALQPPDDSARPGPP